MKNACGCQQVVRTRYAPRGKADTCHQQREKISPRSKRENDLAVKHLQEIPKRDKRKFEKDKKTHTSALLTVLGKALKLNQLCISPVPLHQLPVCTRLDDPALIEDVDDIGLLDRAKAVSHGDRCSTLGRLV